jgi:hypothetical protein
MGKINSIGIRLPGLDGRPVIAKFTGLSSASHNSKTGGMIQNYILPEQWMEDKMMGDDTSVCGDCPHSFRAGDTCYLHKGSARMGLISTMKKWPDILMPLRDEDLMLSMLRTELVARSVRFGAYGEPILLGERLVSFMCSVASHWTGYTHQWRRLEYQWAKQYFMASVDSSEDYFEAKSMGWRTFRTRSHADAVYPTEAQCPASKEMGKITTCDRCKLCMGTSKKARDITIIKH